MSTTSGFMRYCCKTLLLLQKLGPVLPDKPLPLIGKGCTIEPADFKARDHFIAARISSVSIKVQ